MSFLMFFLFISIYLLILIHFKERSDCYLCYI